jgi:hypothetical protein
MFIYITKLDIILLIKIAFKVLIISVLCFLYIVVNLNQILLKKKIRRKNTDDIIDDQMDDYRQEMQQQLEENND